MNPNHKIIYSIIERFLKGNKKEERPIYLIEALGIKTREVISLTGAGGKTTLMFRLAKELLLEGKKVVTTTTTKILEPTSGETSYLFIDSDEEKVRQFITSNLSRYGHITIAREKLESGKLKGISLALVNGLWSLEGIDMMIIEADGAAGRTVKAPREGEPVIPPNTTLVVAILGVDGIEKELNEENVFQAQRISQITGISLGEKMTEDAIAVLMTHPKGIFKGAPPLSRVVAFLNKVDIPDGREKARRVAQKILEKKHPQIERIVLGQLRDEPPVVEVFSP